MKQDAYHAETLTRDIHHDTHALVHGMLGFPAALETNPPTLQWGRGQKRGQEVSGDTHRPLMTLP